MATATRKQELDRDLREEYGELETSISVYKWVAIGLGLLGLGLFVGILVAGTVGSDEAGGVADLVAAAAAVMAAFWSLAGLFILYVAFLGQRQDLVINQQELRDTREVLDLQREELAGQREQLEAQNETMSRQALEGTFFQLLRTFGEALASIDLVVKEYARPFHIEGERPTSVQVHAGRDAIVLMLTRLNVAMAQQRLTGSEGFEPRPGKSLAANEHEPLNFLGLRAAYEDFYGNHEVELSHYFETLRVVLAFLWTKGPDEKDERAVYADVVSAQLSVQERALLYYHCRTGTGSGKLCELVDRFKLLDPVMPGHLLNEDHGRILVAGPLGEID